MQGTIRIRIPDIPIDAKSIDFTNVLGTYSKIEMDIIPNRGDPIKDVKVKIDKDQICTLHNLIITSISGELIASPSDLGYELWNWKKEDKISPSGEVING